MSSIFPSSYQLKKALFSPHTAFMRWKYRKVSGAEKDLLELYYYRSAAIEFIAATQRNQHLLHDANIDSDSVVVDVDAATGDWAQQLVDRFDPVIYAFEPVPDAFAKLQERAVDNPKLQPMPYSLGDQDGLVEIALDGDKSPIFSHPENHADRRVKGKVVAIDTVWAELKLGQIDLMRIDINGGEFALLDKMIRTDLLNKVDCFLIQFHEWHSGAYHKRIHIREELSKTHRLEWDYYFIWEKWVRI